MILTGSCVYVATRDGEAGQRPRLRLRDVRGATSVFVLERAQDAR
jgi:hypothetical protein